MRSRTPLHSVGDIADTPRTAATTTPTAAPATAAPTAAAAAADHPTRARTRTRTALLRASVAGAAGLALAVGLPTAASAHVDLEASSTAPATLSVLTFAVGHGCEGSPTTSLAIELPADVQAITPTIKPGWSITETPTEPTTSSGPSAGPTTDTSDPGTDLSSGTGTGTGTGTTITYTADTPLPDGYRDTVQISALLPVAGQPGDVVVFPTLQTCESGSTAWNELPSGDPADPEPNLPAPALTLTAAETDTTSAGVGDQGTAAAGADEATRASSADPVDMTARTLGLGALLVAAVAVVLLTIALRRQQEARR
jgi:uncharacterized protein YcnI